MCHLVSDAYTTPNESQMQQQIPHRDEGVKEKESAYGSLCTESSDRLTCSFLLSFYFQIILSQEKSIQRLTELIRDLKEQIQHYQRNNETSNGAFSS
ncbi:hypothetical protein ACS0TY_019204 [Phlomoides rotata]